MKIKNIKLFLTMIPAITAVSCVGDLDQYPHTDYTSHDVYATVDGYESVIAGAYGALLFNQSSISDDDKRQNFTRCLTAFQECSTDILDDVWLNGDSMTDVNNQSWNAGDQWVSAMYYHIYNIISIANEFIRNASDEAISSFSDDEKSRISIWKNEARGLRALAYYWAMDFFPAMPFVTEDDPVGSYIPETYDRKQMFSFLETELKELSDLLPKTSYGHFNRGAARTLLARMYLNAETYTGEAHYTECITYCDKVINDGYSLETGGYELLFNADNHKRTNEIIFALATDATNSVAWGGGTYLVCAPRFDNDAGMYEDFGVDSYWNTLRVRPQLVDLFDRDGDSRAMFGDKDRIAYSTEIPEGYYALPNDTKYLYRDRAKEIAGHGETTSGWLMNKWSNITDEGEVASSTRVNGAETDYPVFRLADVYLMYAEAVIRGGNGGSRTDALDYVNDIRERAFGSSDGNIEDSEMTLDFILDERGRELYSEGIRRTDLIRFGKYTSGYHWNWKGGVAEGCDVDEKYIYLPIPEAELSANPGMKEINMQYGF